MEKVMTIDSNLSRIRYVGNGVTTNFSVPFPYLTNADGTAQLAVYLGDSNIPLVEKQDYVVEGLKEEVSSQAIYEGRFNGGNIIFSNPPETGVAVAIIRNVPLTQAIVFIEGEKFPAQDFENALDKQTMMVQEVKENLARAIVLPPGSTENPLIVRDALIEARDEAVSSSYNALKAVNTANKLLEEVTNYVDTSIQEIDKTIDQAVEDVKNEAVAAAEGAIQDAANTAIQIAANHTNKVIIPPLQEYADSAATSAENAQTQATNAATSASSALASKTSAESYASQAKNYATSASTSEANAQKYAIRAENSLLPNQTGNAGKVLLTDGFAPYWGKSSNHQVVSVLPVEPEEDVFYYIPE